MPKTKIEIIAETYEAYKDASNRAIIGEYSACAYKLPDGRMCAFGRCEINPVISFNPNHTVGGSVITRQIAARQSLTEEEALKASDQDVLDSLLKPEYRGHDSSFWLEIQRLHDTQEFFNTETWSEKGLARIAELKLVYADKSPAVS
jgi:hypothetical protein